MSNTKHEVTVYDRVPATAAVSVAQVESYLRRTGWTGKVPVGMREMAWFRGEWEPGFLLQEGEDPERTARSIDWIATLEKRQPSAVLADIAREPES